MAVLAPFLVLCTFVSGFHHVEATAETLFSWDTDYSRGKLSVTYPELTIKYGDKVPKPLREAITTKWDIPTIRFPAAEEGKKYVLVMVDPDAPRPEKPTAAFWRHWLIVDLKQSTRDVSMQACETEIEESSMRGAHSFSHRAQVPQLPLQWRDLGRVSSLHLFPQAEQLPQ